MKILQLCKQFPYPLKDGYSIAVNALAKSLHDLNCEVILLSMNTTKHYFDLAQLPAEFDHYQKIYTVKVDNRITPWGAFFNLFSTTSFILSRFITKDFGQKLEEILKNQSFDVVQLESVQLAPYIPIIRANSTAKIAMRAHNVEFEIWERHVSQTQFWLKKMYLQSQMRSFRAFEIAQLQQYDWLIAITKEDLRKFEMLGFSGKGVVLPVGIDANIYQPDWSAFSKKINLSFIGSLDWMPNQEGLAWFLEKVFPVLSKQHPDIEIHIAGRHTPRWLRELANKQVIFHGEVEEAMDFINAYPIMIVPLFSGSGIRVKILEGMALGRVIVTTSIGMEGISAKHQTHLFCVDSVDAFLETLNFCVENRQALKRIGENARQFIQKNFDNLELVRRLF